MSPAFDDVPELVRLRTVAARFFVAALWLQAPILLKMAERAGIDAIAQGALLAVLAIVPTLFVLRLPRAPVTRMTVSAAMALMAVLLVFDNPGRLQVEFHFYFFVVFATLVAFVDWRCIALAAVLTAGSDVLLETIAPARIFPEGEVAARVLLQMSMIFAECGVLVWVVLRLRRVLVNTDRAQALAEANAAVASTDILTQLPNRRAFTQDLTREISRARRYGNVFTLALIDVDEFKAINDRAGHPHGDRVLISLAYVLRSLRGEDRAYRIGGDEFAVLLAESGTVAARGAMERVRERAERISRGATVSIGYVTVGGQHLDLDPLELADAALYEAKHRGRNVVVSFEELNEKTTVLSPRRAESLKALLAHERVDVAFQPIWDIEGGRAFGFEALARPDDTLDLAGPADAFDLAERLHVVPQLDRLCVRKALEAAARLPADALVFVNVTPAWLESVGFDAQWLVRAAAAAGVAPARIVLEVTERRVTDPDALVGHARTLNDLGFRLALDDTGSGGAGLEILSKVAFAYVKIERSLLVKALDDKIARGVLAGIIAIARENGTYLIAEGIENERLLEFVRSTQAVDQNARGIRGAQGYLLGRPTLGEVDAEALQAQGAHLGPYRDDSVA